MLVIEVMSYASKFHPSKFHWRPNLWPWVLYENYTLAVQLLYNKSYTFLVSESILLSLDLLCLILKKMLSSLFLPHLSLRWCTLLRRNIQELWQVSWNSYRISLLPCFPLWTTGCHGLTFPLLTVLKTSVPAQATTPTPCSYVGSQTGQPTATSQRGECYIQSLMEGTVWTMWQPT